MEKIVIKKDIRKEEKVEAKDEKESLLANVFRYHCSTNIDAFNFLTFGGVKLADCGLL
jgi:hypothetical protein